MDMVSYESCFKLSNCDKILAYQEWVMQNYTTILSSKIKAILSVVLKPRQQTLKDFLLKGSILRLLFNLLELLPQFISPNLLLKSGFLVGVIF